MGHEDKLTHRQRVRLEALAQTQQAAHLHFPDRDATTEKVLEKAEQIEKWLLAADQGVN